MIINIRGTSGAGKSTLSRLLMERIGVECVLRGRKSERIWAYSLKTWYEDNERKLYVIGDYTNVCGGADTVGNCQRIMDEVANLAVEGRGDVIF